LALYLEIFAFLGFWKNERQRISLGRNVFCCDGELWYFDRGACSTCFAEITAETFLRLWKNAKG
jgi:hypothetical protein